MKNLDLNNYGVQELGAVEMRETDGGEFCVACFVAGAIIGGAIYDVWKEFGKQYMKTAQATGGASVVRAH